MNKLGGNDVKLLLACSIETFYVIILISFYSKQVDGAFLNLVNENSLDLVSKFERLAQQVSASHDVTGAPQTGEVSSKDLIKDQVVLQVPQGGNMEETGLCKFETDVATSGSSFNVVTTSQEGSYILNMGIPGETPVTSIFDQITEACHQGGLQDSVVNVSTGVFTGGEVTNSQYVDSNGVSQESGEDTENKYTSESETLGLNSLGFDFTDTTPVNMSGSNTPQDSAEMVVQPQMTIEGSSDMVVFNIEHLDGDNIVLNVVQQKPDSGNVCAEGANPRGQSTETENLSVAQGDQNSLLSIIGL